MKRQLWILCALSVFLLAMPAAHARLQLPLSPELTEYANATPNDAITRLQQKIDTGDLKLDFDEEHGYLKSLLKALGVPSSSQGLVFSKTSFQADKIGPWSPRAIYFNDDVYIGWVQRGDIIEIATADPRIGAVFYTLKQTPSPTPTFRREIANCIQCHSSSMNTGGVPGFVVQSIYSDRLGYPIPSGHDPVSTDRTPLRYRFGGWYVTGTSGNFIHMGNLVAREAGHEIGNAAMYLQRLQVDSTKNVTDLSERFNTEPYLKKGSDLAALMLLVHQTTIHNLMTQASFAQKSGKEENEKAEALVRGLLFVREAPIPSTIQSSEEFAREFSRIGPRDHLGRSLRDLDLNQRLLKYPLSYLIYSEGFEALPSTVRRYVYRRLNEILSSDLQDRNFSHLTPELRKGILQILLETKPDFAAFSAAPY
jgi:hypothetical protein